MAKPDQGGSERRQDREPPLPEFSLVWQDQGVRSVFPRLDVLHAHTRIQRDDPGGKFPFLDDAGAAEFLLQVLQVREIAAGDINLFAQHVLQLIQVGFGNDDCLVKHAWDSLRFPIQILRPPGLPAAVDPGPAHSDSAAWCSEPVLP